MIYVDINGRLGNQMFEYAFARWLQIQCNDEMTCGFQAVEKYKKYEGDGWENALRHFNVNEFMVDNGKRSVLISKSTLIQKLIGVIYYLSYAIYRDNIHLQKRKKVQVAWQLLLNKLGLYWITNGDFTPIVTKTRNKIVKGHFENSKYFNSIRDIILKEFTPRHNLLEKNINFYNSIISTESTCVTIRRGDFVTNMENEKLLNVCTKEYYYKGMDIVANKIDNPKFFIFSDDIIWVRNNMKFIYDVNYEDGNDPVWEKLRLMYSCKHFVISNSTFSWWAQYLSENPNKIIVSPNKWFNNDFESSLIEESFIKVEV